MRIGSFVIILCLLPLYVGCSSSMKRIGYEKPLLEPRENCTVKFIEQKEAQKIPGTLLGTLKMGDTGFSVNCNKETVLRKIKDEACRIGANIVVLRDIHEPGFVSTCYRVTADLIQSSDSLTVDYDVATHKQNSADGRKPFKGFATFYGTLGYSDAKMQNLNESIDHAAASLSERGGALDWNTFSGSIDFNIGFTARLWRHFSFGSDISFQSLSVDNSYTDQNLEVTDRVEANVLDLELARVDFWIPNGFGTYIGVFGGLAIGNYHEVSSAVQQDPGAFANSDISFTSLTESYGAFIGVQRSILSDWAILLRAGYRSRLLNDQMNIGVSYIDTFGRPIETDFSGFYINAGIGRIVKVKDKD